MISDEDIYKQAYADGLNRGYLIAQSRAESRYQLGLPLVANAAYDTWLEQLTECRLTIDEWGAAIHAGVAKGIGTTFSGALNELTTVMDRQTD